MIKTIGKRLLIILVIAVLVIGGILLIKAKKGKEAQIPVAKVYPMVVKAIQVAPKEVKLTLPYLSLVENDENVMLTSRMSARVLMIKKSGQVVHKGDLLATLDTEELTANIEAVKISLKNLLNTHQRTQALYKVKGASIEQLQKEESNIASLKSKLKALQSQMSYTTLLSPVNGVIAKTFATQGSIAMPGKPLINISATEGFSLRERLPDDITPKSIIYNNKTYPIQALGSTFHGLNEYKSYVSGIHLSAGETVDISVVVFEGIGTKLPFDAILNKNGKSYVLLVKDHIAHAKEIHIAAKGEQGVVIKEDLRNEKIIVAKQDILLKLLTGITIKVEE